MASKAKPKAKKSAKPKSAKKDKVTRLPGVGHNGGKVNKPLVKMFDDYAKMDEDKKQISKAQRDIRARAKEEHGVNKDVFGHEVKLRKMASDARVMFEQGHADLKESLGYQHVLPGLLDGGSDGADADEGDDGYPDPEEAGANAA